MDILYIVIPAYNESENINGVIEEWYPIIEKYNGVDKILYGLVKSDDYDQAAIFAGASAMLEANDNGVFESDEQLQSSFIRYFTYSVKKPLSSYTLNDYCSRLRNLWLTFCESEDADLEGIYISKEQCNAETPLLNVYNNVQTLRFFVDKNNKGTDNKKKWANAGAALSKLEEFIKENNK